MSRVITQHTPCFLQAVVEELEKKLREAHTKGLEEAAEETNSQAQEENQVAASQAGENDTQPSRARDDGDESGGAERFQVDGSIGRVARAEELSSETADTEDMKGRTERELEMLEDKENKPEEGSLHSPITPQTSK